MAGEGWATEQRGVERREDWAAPPCGRPCEAVDDKLESLVTWKVFAWIVSGIGAVGLLAIAIMTAVVGYSQTAINVNQTAILSSKSDIRVNTFHMAVVKDYMKEIKRELRNLNGKGRGEKR
ncbi:hypothetical protein LCGC14_1265420 [marine sediment metagenome]|uniref:Uncharacterized protein n=1 Tax=marine sediment metagenome TaxID=412755 RepID=A0A0F9LKR4_9ZZZZ|nr:hypothetical protein [Desulfobacterales bacterium]